jgi:hypothetical protein
MPNLKKVPELVRNSVDLTSELSNYILQDDEYPEEDKSMFYLY